MLKKACIYRAFLLVTVKTPYGYSEIIYIKQIISLPEMLY